jgi:hypothetical protein
MWGLSAWENFQVLPQHVVPAVPALSGTSSTSASLQMSAKLPGASHASDSVHSNGSRGIAGSPSDASAAIQASSSVANTGHEPMPGALAPQQPEAKEQAEGVGDGSEFWS